MRIIKMRLNILTPVDTDGEDVNEMIDQALEVLGGELISSGYNGGDQLKEIVIVANVMLPASTHNQDVENAFNHAVSNLGGEIIKIKMN